MTTGRLRCSLALAALSALLLAACSQGSRPAGPADVAATATGGTTRTVPPSPAEDAVNYTEEYLSERANAWFTDQSVWAESARVNVQADGEVYWYLDGGLYGVDVWIDWHLVRGTRVVVENGRLGFAPTVEHWLGFTLRPESLPADLRTAILDLHHAVAEGLNAELEPGGWEPVAVTADDRSLTVTVRRQ